MKHFLHFCSFLRDFLHFCSFLRDFISKISPTCSADILSTASKLQKAVIYLTGKLDVLDKIYAGMSCSAVDSELNVNESTVYIK